jgi:hypothetical protein
VVRLLRWIRREKSDEAGLDERAREENDEFRAEHAGLIRAPGQAAADRWQRRVDEEFEPPSSY